MLTAAPAGLTQWALAEFSSRLHSLRDGHPEQGQAQGQHVEGERAEGEPAGPQRRGLRLEYRALLVERGEQAGHVEQVGAEPVRLGGLADAGEDRAEAEQLQRERAVGTRGDRYPRRLRPRKPRGRGGRRG